MVNYYRHDDPYTARFAKTLHSDIQMSKNNYPLQDLARSLTDETVRGWFQECSSTRKSRDLRWIKQELWRWGKKLRSPQPFVGTLQNLYLYCKIKDLTPNDILFPHSESKVTLLKLDSVSAIVNAILSKKDELNPCEFSIPVLLDPFNMSAIILVIAIDELSSSITFKTTSTAYARFFYCKWDGYHSIADKKNSTGEYQLKEIHHGRSQPLGASAIRISPKNSRLSTQLEEAYDLAIKREFPARNENQTKFHEIICDCMRLSSMPNLLSIWYSELLEKKHDTLLFRDISLEQPQKETRSLGNKIRAANSRQILSSSCSLSAANSCSG